MYNLQGLYTPKGYCALEGHCQTERVADVASVSARAGQAEPIFMGGGGQGMMDSLPGPPGMMMGGDPMQGLSRGFPGDSSWRCGRILDFFWCMYHSFFDLAM